MCRKPDEFDLLRPGFVANPVTRTRTLICVGQCSYSVGINLFFGSSRHRIQINLKPSRYTSVDAHPTPKPLYSVHNLLRSCVGGVLAPRWWWTSVVRDSAPDPPPLRRSSSRVREGTTLRTYVFFPRESGRATSLVSDTGSREEMSPPLTPGPLLSRRIQDVPSVNLVTGVEVTERRTKV